MQKLSVQAPRGVVMIRPHHFSPNAATAGDNVFQAMDAGRSAAAIATAAHGEVTRAAEALEAMGIAVHLFEEFSVISEKDFFNTTGAKPILSSFKGDSVGAQLLLSSSIEIHRPRNAGR
jgi:hypothetical protein